ncbi:MAG: S-layer homology domain-containing protein, partial [Clostridiales Family XIII bacterium]|nr:S-layer homology domain-containing protein [Clostridiales Family XIII bacterium]
GDNGYIRNGAALVKSLEIYVAKGTDWSTITAPDLAFDSDYEFEAWTPSFPLSGYVSYDIEFEASFKLIAGAGYSVTYEAGEGSGTVPVDARLYRAGEQAKVLGGSSLTGPTGKDFAGWKINGAGSVYTEGSYVTVNKDLVLEAYYIDRSAADTAKITLIENFEGSIKTADEPIYAKIGDRIVLPGEVEGFAHNGYRIIGWGTEPTTTIGDIGYYSLSDAYIVEGDASLYAIWRAWSENEIRISFRASDNGRIRSGSDSVKFIEIYVEKGTDWSTITAPTPVADSDYEFEKWTPNFPLTGYVSYDIEFTASFVVNAAGFMIKFETDSNGTLTGDTEFYVPPGERLGDRVTPPTVTPIVSQSFRGWDPAFDADAIVSGSMVFTAVYETRTIYEVPDNMVSAYTGVYDGQAHAVAINEAVLLVTPFVIEYSLTNLDTEAAGWSAAPITRVEPGRTDVFVKVSHPDYNTKKFESYIEISRSPNMILTVASISVAYDGQPHMISAAQVNVSGAAISYTLNNLTYQGTLPPGVTARGRYTIDVEATHDYYETARATVTVDITGGGSGGYNGGGMTPTPIEDLNPDDLTQIDDEDVALAAFITTHIKYLNGYPDGTIKPDTAITRAEAATILFRLLADPAKEVPTASAFGDVSDSSWYAQSVSYMASRQFVTGYEDSTFRPDARITRAEFITILTRLDNTPVSVGAIALSDIAGHWAENSIRIAAAKGWIHGYEDGTFKPQNEITRAEVVTIINNMLNRGIDLEDIPADAPSFTDLTTSHWAYTDIIEATAPDHGYIRKENGQEIWQPLIVEAPIAAPPAATDAAITTDAAVTTGVLSTGTDTTGVATLALVAQKAEAVKENL